MSESYRDLMVWQKSMDLVVEVYRLVKMLPREEMFALSDQMRRAAVSIPSNIAEGKNRCSEKEFRNFLSIARGSNAELETQLMICVRIGYLQDTDIAKAKHLVTEVGKMLYGLMAALG